MLKRLNFNPKKHCKINWSVLFTRYFGLRDSVSIEALAVIEVSEVRACPGFTVPEHRTGKSAQNQQREETHPVRDESDVQNQIQRRGEARRVPVRINASTAAYRYTAPFSSHAQWQQLNWNLPTSRVNAQSYERRDRTVYVRSAHWSAHSPARLAVKARVVRGLVMRLLRSRLPECAAERHHLQGIGFVCRRVTSNPPAGQWRRDCVSPQAR